MAMCAGRNGAPPGGTCDDERAPEDASAVATEAEVKTPLQPGVPSEPTKTAESRVRSEAGAIAGDIISPASGDGMGEGEADVDSPCRAEGGGRVPSQTALGDLERTRPYE